MIEQFEHGCFAWIMEPEGYRIELWEPPITTKGEHFSPATLHSVARNTFQTSRLTIHSKLGTFVINFLDSDCYRKGPLAFFGSNAYVQP